MTRLQFITTLLLAIPGVKWLVKKVRPTITIDPVPKRTFDFYDFSKLKGNDGDTITNDDINECMETEASWIQDGNLYRVNCDYETGIKTTYKNGVLISTGDITDDDDLLPSNFTRYGKFNRHLTESERKEVEDYFDFCAEDRGDIAPKGGGTYTAFDKDGKLIINYESKPGDTTWLKG